MTTRRVVIAGVVVVLIVGLLVWDRNSEQQPAVDSSRDAGLSIAGGLDDSAESSATTVNDVSDANTEEESGDDLEFTTCIRALAANLDFQEDQLEANGGRTEAARAAAATLAESPDPEHRLAVELLNRWGPASTAPEGNFVPALNEPLHIWYRLNSCPLDEEKKCNDETLEQALVSLDASNSEAWAVTALGRYRREDMAGALAAMQRAAAGAVSNSYWTETVELIDRALLAATDYEYRSRTTLALGSTFWMQQDLNGIILMCDERSAATDEWARACEAYGELIARQHDALEGRRFGAGIQARAARELGYDEYADQLEASEQERLSNQSLLAFDIVLMSDPTLLHRHLDNVRTNGQRSATEDLLARELPPLLDQFGMNDCAEHFL